MTYQELGRLIKKDEGGTVEFDVTKKRMISLKGAL